ncbi:hypothetical protein PoB_003905600 [Plakobranchus ocellatus]|uniref:Uncharacterized protein n=1 Tax=Plakobranchus ocellatus TaxID=259542 RepID=A0AAV4AN18_9GAST|nr:hypothetical protein PoB_003905600 [Plakobranchus ocellatus]
MDSHNSRRSLIADAYRLFQEQTTQQSQERQTQQFQQNVSREEKDPWQTQASPRADRRQPIIIQNFELLPPGQSHLRRRSLSTANLYLSSAALKRQAEGPNIKEWLHNAQAQTECEKLSNNLLVETDQPGSSLNRQVQSMRNPTQNDTHVAGGSVESLPLVHSKEAMKPVQGGTISAASPRDLESSHASERNRYNSGKDGVDAYKNAGTENQFTDSELKDTKTESCPAVATWPKKRNKTKKQVTFADTVPVPWPYSLVEQGKMWITGNDVLPSHPPSHEPVCEDTDVNNNRFCRGSKHHSRTGDSVPMTRHNSHITIFPNSTTIDSGDGAEKTPYPGILKNAAATDIRPHFCPERLNEGVQGDLCISFASADSPHIHNYLQSDQSNLAHARHWSVQTPDTGHTRHMPFAYNGFRATLHSSEYSGNSNDAEDDFPKTELPTVSPPSITDAAVTSNSSNHQVDTCWTKTSVDETERGADASSLNNLSCSAGEDETAGPKSILHHPLSYGHLSEAEEIERQELKKPSASEHFGPRQVKRDRISSFPNGNDGQRDEHKDIKFGGFLQSNVVHAQHRRRSDTITYTVPQLVDSIDLSEYLSSIHHKGIVDSHTSATAAAKPNPSHPQVAYKHDSHTDRTSALKPVESSSKPGTVEEYNTVVMRLNFLKDDMDGYRKRNSATSHTYSNLKASNSTKDLESSYMTIAGKSLQEKKQSLSFESAAHKAMTGACEGQFVPDRPLKPFKGRPGEIYLTSNIPRPKTQGEINTDYLMKMYSSTGERRSDIESETERALSSKPTSAVLSTNETKPQSPNVALAQRSRIVSTATTSVPSSIFTESHRSGSYRGAPESRQDMLERGAPESKQDMLERGAPESRQDMLERKLALTREDTLASTPRSRERQRRLLTATLSHDASSGPSDLALESRRSSSPRTGPHTRTRSSSASCYGTSRGRNLSHERTLGAMDSVLFSARLNSARVGGTRGRGVLRESSAGPGTRTPLNRRLEMLVLSTTRLNTPTAVAMERSRSNLR